MFNDLRYAIRRLSKSRQFTVLAVLVLTAGIGANTAIFSLTNALLLRPLPGVEKPDSLVLLGRTYQGSGFDMLSFPDFSDLRHQATGFSGLAAYRRTALHLGSGATAIRVRGALVSGDYFAVLGARTSRGRFLSPDDNVGLGANRVAVISDRLWKGYFASGSNLVGGTIDLNGTAFTVVGIAADGFRGTDSAEVVDIWLPLTMYAQANPLLATSDNRLVARHIVWLQVFGRLKPTITFEKAQAEMSTLARRLEQTFPNTNRDTGVALVSSVGLDPQKRQEAHQFATLLMAAAGLVLLIACANVANLLLARGVSRQKEIGIRLALGASRARLICQLLSEALLLVLLSGGLGLFFTFWLNDLLVNFIPLPNLQPTALDFSLDARVAGFGVAVSLLTVVLFGMAPAWQSSKAELMVALKDRAGSPHRTLKFHNLLIVGQVALSLVVLICAGLFVRTLQKAQAIQPGFNTSDVLLAPMDLGQQGYSEAQGRLFYQEVVERVRALPGVKSASLSVTVPLAGGAWRTGVQLEGLPSDKREIPCDYNIVGPGYFQTLGIPVVSGRDFSPQDDASTPGVAIINETFARQFFPNENPLGKRMATAGDRKVLAHFEVVGVAKDSKYQTLFEPPRPHLFLPLFQQYASAMTLLVRADRTPETLIRPVHQEIQTLDKNLRVFSMRPLSGQLSDLLTPQRSTARLIAAFGLLALLLANVGLYGVMAYSVSQRSREIGIRMALGAQQGEVFRWTLRRGLRLAFLGVFIGVAAALALTRLFASRLFGVGPTDPVTFMIVPLVLVAVALLACYLPARRATKVDPMMALRCE